MQRGIKDFQEQESVSDILYGLWLPSKVADIIYGFAVTTRHLYGVPFLPCVF
jgi:hypothetical protein